MVRENTRRFPEPEAQNWRSNICQKRLRKEMRSSRVQRKVNADCVSEDFFEPRSHKV